MEARLIILQVVPSYYPATVYGGPIFSIHYACQALARQGVEIAVATTNANGGGRLDVDCHGPVTFEPNYQVRYYNDTIVNRFSWAFTRHLGRDIRCACIVHLQDVFSAHAAWTLILTALYRKPLLVSARGVLAPWGLSGKRPWLKKLWLSMLVRPLASNSRRVCWHATAESERHEILDVLPESRVVVVPNGIDCGAFDSVAPPSRTSYVRRFFPGCSIAPDRARILVCLGRLHAKKAFDVAIKAFQAIAKGYPEAILAIAGADDGEGEALMQLVRRLGLEHRITLVGEVKGLEKIFFLKGADLFLFPTHNENFGMVVLEALTAGLPVIASRDSPWSELEALGSGLWVRNTPEDFAAAILELFSKDLGGMRASARSHATRYDLSAIAGSFRKIYETLVHEQS
jgi:glycosyltransferase involved in cell wall biosynthesis